MISDFPTEAAWNLFRPRRQYPVRGIAISGFGMEEDVEKSKEAGFAEHLTEPINFQKLEAVITEVIGHPSDT